MAEVQEAPGEQTTAQFGVRDLANNDAFWMLAPPDRRAIFLHRAQNDPEFKKLFPDKAAWEVVYETFIREAAGRKPPAPQPETTTASQSETTTATQPETTTEIPIQHRTSEVIGLQDNTEFLEREA